MYFINIFVFHPKNCIKFILITLQKYNTQKKGESQQNFASSSIKTDGAASLDRIDSKKDYTIDNVQWVHKDLNYMKQDFTEEEFINYCKLVVNYALNKPSTIQI